MEGIVEAGGKHHDKFLKLVEAGGTRWLSHNNSLKRLIRVFVKVAKLLHHISEDRDFDAGERSRASALLERMLYKKTILCICVVSDVLAQLATLTNAFQSREWTLDRAVDLTTSVIGQLDDMLKNESLTGSCDSATKLLDDLRVDEFEVIEKTRKLRGCRTDATTAEETADDHLRKYIEALVAELRRRFSDDCRVIAYLDVFNHPVWKVRVPSVAERFGFDAETLVAESQNIAKHIDLMPSLRAAVTPPATIEGKVNFKRNFWLAFCGDHYSRTMFPEHCKVAAFLLTCPISSSNVERAFSYTTRIDSNIRAALAPETVCKLVRISMQGPSFPGIAQQTWPPEKRSLEQTDAEIDLRDFINEVFDKWFHSRRRINQVVSK
ncbi:hypothetical protein Pmar_PMAR017055 [Perkinsus marinus ATCC 50983]|uniref:HAT C-terminal dimerisation domain-containing protein n=1 Tax=Perkinsus marinus (strain ATCC 50983 / TXsc) TaxID=423536 RepID=C5LSF6_PERM5|nr:hypothetical protein Pmar_PMAR017055 [Perkinsus marinus ATCC 50983]EER00197.1 hypothetical protein Pmar_PMAR017055 [Perkinsus marinus ATCC 50983]|eukprot:XP_002767479.1 hypothetical protein Pmar_PMAR017055 [Perkinsus marinus ATCC 50983]